MHKILKSVVAAVVVVALAVTAQAQDILQGLQDISVTMKSGNSQGSGTLFTRELPNGDTVTFVWTAGHVVDNLRQIKSVIDPATGTERSVAQFDDAAIVREFTEDGRRIGETKMDAKVLKFSDAEEGEDLALLLVRKRNYTPLKTTAKFYKGEIPTIGTELYHVGSLLGQFGANSLTTGVVSQQGRVLNFKGNNVIFDQTTVTSFPGSSGGGVFKKDTGEYVGMLVRGAGEGFNFIVPIRRLRAFCEKNNLLWAIDPSVPLPSLEEIDKIKPDATGVEFKLNLERANKGSGSEMQKKFPYLVVKGEEC